MASKTQELLQYLKNQPPRKLFKILNRLESFGEGRKVTRVIWKTEEHLANNPNFQLPYWTITRVIPHKVHIWKF